MPKYFMRDTPYFAFEAMMMEPPHSHRNGADDDEAVIENSNDCEHGKEKVLFGNAEKGLPGDRYKLRGKFMVKKQKQIDEDAGLLYNMQYKNLVSTMLSAL